jgi:hypothetical protein
MKTFKVFTTNAFGALAQSTKKSTSVGMLILQCIDEYPNVLDVAIFDCAQSQFVAHKPCNCGWKVSVTQSLRHSRR